MQSRQNAAKGRTMKFLAHGILAVLLFLAGGCATSTKTAPRLSHCLTETTSCERTCYDAARAQMAACKTIGCREYVLRTTTLDSCVAKCGDTFATCNGGGAK